MQNEIWPSIGEHFRFYAATFDDPTMPDHSERFDGVASFEAPSFVIAAAHATMECDERGNDLAALFEFLTAEARDQFVSGAVSFADAG